MARLVARVKQRRLRGVILALACLAGGPALASIVPSTVPPADDTLAVRPPTAPVVPAAPGATTPTSIGTLPTTSPTVLSPAASAPAADAPPPGWTAAPDTPAPTAAPAPNAAGPALTLDRPEVPNTGRLSTSAHNVALYGVTGLAGEFAINLHGAIAADGGRVTCQPQADGAYQCALPDGTDVAALALRNGAAQTRADAPEHYRELESLARDERRGLWASLPPPPARLEHPTVLNTATLTVGGATYRLDGLTGLGGQYARDLQGYIQANGDALICSPQGESGKYVCLMPDQTDLAKLVLVNGAARVASDAPDSYRVEQGDALINRRGYWKNPPSGAVAAARAAPTVTSYALPTGDDGGDGVRYVGGAPAATIDGQTVFLMFAGAAGWGYCDQTHRWHGAPARYGRHMERYHPGGHGLRGYRGGSHGGFVGSPSAHGGRPGGGYGVSGYDPEFGGRRPDGGFVRPSQMRGGALAPGSGNDSAPNSNERNHR